MSQLVQDLRYTMRTLRNSPGFAAVALLTLALGIGANTAIFSFVDGVLLKPLPYPEPDRILRVAEKRPDGGANGISTLNFLDWKKQNTVFEYLAAQTGWGATLSGINEPILLRGARVSPDYFGVNQMKAALGRTFLPDEDQPGKDHVVILSNVLWQNQFGGDRGIIGQTIRLDNEPYTVVGVMPQGSVFDRSRAQIWKPLAFEPADMTRNFHWFGAFARLKPGVTLEQARAQMDAIGARIAKAYPDSNKGWGVSLERFSDVLVGPQLRTSLYVLFAAVGMVLLIGCANLANLAMARGVSREREVSIRAALGAGRRRLIGQFLTENVVLAVCGGLLGIGLGYGMMKWLQASIPPNALPAEASIAMDSRVLLFALAISILTGLLFGLAPALQATKPDLASTIKEGGRSSTSGGGRRRLRDALVVAEVALAFVLLVGSGLLIRSFFGLIDVNPGFDSTDILTMGLPIAAKQYPDPVQLNNYFREVRMAIDAVPGVRETALTSALPLEGWGYGMPYQIEGRTIVDRANRRGCFFKMVSPSYFQTLGIQFKKGRGLTEHDTQGAPPVAVINETLAKREFANQDPIGQRILVQQIVPGKPQLGPEIAWQVVGVIADEKINGLNDDKSPGMYVSNEQSPAYGVNLIVRANVNPAGLQKSIRTAVDSVNKDQALSDIRTLDQIKAQSMASSRLETTLLSVFAAIALLLAAIGIYGVISYSVAQRTQEMGIRAALGASSGSLLRLVLVNGLTLTGIGLVIGVAGALALTRLLAAILFGVGARDPLTMAAVGVVLAAVAVAACFFPARRATKVDPMIALRYE